MTIVRAPRPDAGFTIIHNETLRDRRLSYRARGILASILSRPDDWRTSAESLTREGVEGRHAILSALTELEDAGYLVRDRVQDPISGRWSSSSTIYDRPVDGTGVGLPNPGEPNSGEPASGNPPVIEELEKKNREEELTAPSGAGEVVARYVDEFRQVHGAEPPRQALARIGRDARVMLVEERRDPASVVAAAEEAARSGHPNLASALTRVLASGGMSRRERALRAGADLASELAAAETASTIWELTTGDEP